MKIEQAAALKHALSNGVNLFLGAGFSVLASDANGRMLPTANALAQDLLRFFHREDLASLPLTNLITVLRKEPDKVDQYLRGRFTVAAFSPAYGALKKHAINSIFTTNIDDLIPKIYKDSQQHYLRNVMTAGPDLWQRARIDYVPLHGSVSDVSSPLYFEASELAATFSADPTRWHALALQLARAPTIFWGYAMGDPGLQAALNSRATNVRERKEAWVVLRKDDAASREYFSALGFHIAIGDTQEFLTYLDAAPAVIPTSVSRGVLDVLPELQVPDSGTIVEVRPLEVFFQGDEPTWYDIGTSEIPRTSHFLNVREEILNNKSVIISGIPACGKSTLLMQLARDMSSSRHCLFAKYISHEQAKLCIRCLSPDDRVCVFLDNFSDSREAVELLSTDARVQLVLADQEYFVDMADGALSSHHDVSTMDVSDLSRDDILSITRSVPKGVRAESPLNLTDEKISTFELIERSVRLPRIRTRVRDALRTLSDRDERMHDLLIACGYVHWCRVPMSIDMAIAFWRSDIYDYNGVQDAIEQIRSMVRELPDHVVDAEQDYFEVRSQIFADALLQECAPNRLARVLKQFLSQVSPVRIVRFDVFKRRAYDADLIKRAFPNAEDGRNFYEQVLSVYNSPFVLQQGAVYLSHKHLFELAFNWIDRANRLAHGNIMSIRNSYAVILFRAGMSGDRSSKRNIEWIEKSMNVLQECYSRDRRRTYHALVFADHALRYCSEISASKGKDYLETAEKWLEKESKAKASHAGVGRLLKRVTQQLSTIAKTN